jgi:hypothetical protein
MARTYHSVYQSDVILILSDVRKPQRLGSLELVNVYNEKDHIVNDTIRYDTRWYNE